MAWIYELATSQGCMHGAVDRHAHARYLLLPKVFIAACVYVMVITQVGSRMDVTMHILCVHGVCMYTGNYVCMWIDACTHAGSQQDAGSRLFP